MDAIKTSIAIFYCVLRAGGAASSAPTVFMYLGGALLGILYTKTR
jgi:hypothetical protein